MIKPVLWFHGRTHLSGIPDGLMSQILDKLRPDGSMLYLCCGSRPVPDAINLDNNPTARADVIADATRVPFRDGVFSFVLADPPYSQYPSQKLHNCGIIPLYSLMEEMSRLTAAGGLYAILYTFRPHTLVNDSLYMHIVTPGGVHRRPRILSAFRRGAFKAIRPVQYRPLKDRKEDVKDEQDDKG